MSHPNVDSRKISCSPEPPRGPGRQTWLHPVHPPYFSQGARPQPTLGRTKGRGGGCTRPLRALQASWRPPTTHPSVRGLPRNGSEQRVKQPVSRGLHSARGRGARSHSPSTNLVGPPNRTFQERACLRASSGHSGMDPFPTPLPFTRDAHRCQRGRHCSLPSLQLREPSSSPTAHPKLPTAGTAGPCPLRPWAQAGLELLLSRHPDGLSHTSGPTRAISHRPSCPGGRTIRSRDRGGGGRSGRTAPLPKAVREDFSEEAAMMRVTPIGGVLSVSLHLF